MDSPKSFKKERKRASPGKAIGKMSLDCQDKMTRKNVIVEGFWGKENK